MKFDIEKLLSTKPFSLNEKEKFPLFKNAIKESLHFHYHNSNLYHEYCKRHNFNPDQEFSLVEIPYLPSNIFKKVKLLSVPQDSIIRTIHSSSTTGSSPSVILIDKITSERQLQVIISILSDFISKERRHFLVVDFQKNIKDSKSSLSSRSSAVRGLVPFMKSIHFILGDGMTINHDDLLSAIASIDSSKVTIFGFTWVLYLIVQKYHNDEAITKELSKLKEPIILHSGGWKKLQDVKISKEEFNEMLAKFFNTTPEKVIDFYGMVEQLGTIYPDCEYGFKHVPVYSHIIIRNVNSLKQVQDGEQGFIQIITPIPHSYPGISILTDDIGKILGKDDCKCGRKGIYFKFIERSKKAQLEGCGDTFEM